MLTADYPQGGVHIGDNPYRIFQQPVETRDVVFIGTDVNDWTLQFNIFLIRTFSSKGLNGLTI